MEIIEVNHPYHPYLQVCTHIMRSAIYRRADVLQCCRAQTSRIIRWVHVANRSFKLITSVRPLSSSTYDDQPSPSFPLYKPTPRAQPFYESRALPESYIDPRSLPSDRKIRKATKIQLTEKAIQDLPELGEDELRSFYAAVMESGRPLEDDLPRIEDGRKMSLEEKSRVIEGLAGRFIGTEAGPSKLPALNSGLRWKVISDIVEKLRAIKTPMMEEGGTRVSLGLVSRTEWTVLLDEMANRDAREAENLMDLMSVSGLLYVVGLR
jgi:hypothetical protein